jgi:hypothetical protein
MRPLCRSGKSFQPNFRKSRSFIAVFWDAKANGLAIVGLYCINMNCFYLIASVL